MGTSKRTRNYTTMGNAYTYYSFEEYGRGYIGARSKSPIGDDAYMGSYKDKSFNPTQKIILAEYETWEEALEAEVLLHEFYDVARNPHFANQAKQMSKGFSTAGVPSWNAGKSAPWMRTEKSRKTKQKMSESRLKMLENRSEEESSRIAKLGHSKRKPLDRMWITDGNNNLYVSRSSEIPEGWKKGRTIAKSRG